MEFIRTTFADLASDGKFESQLERSQLETVTILSAHFLNIDDMICMIQYYWNFPDALLTSDTCRDKLRPFVGRPLHFVDYVFRDLRLQSFVRKDWADSYEDCEAKFHKYLDAAREKLTQHIEDRLAAFFRCNKSLMPSDLCPQTAASLYPHLIKHILCGAKFITLDDSAAAVAIATRLLPTATTKDVDLKEVEPCTYETALFSS